ncbi:MAG TPA: DNA-binding response regulator, partial [Candidatus Aminicenantes bacterium]|nr:DNA-binding response regulator [Candidatus Aminicenantes bacterium]
MKRILLIEDDEALRKTLTIALEAEGFSVVSTADGRQGLELG